MAERNLERDIFGGSDSDLSDFDEEITEAQLPPRPHHDAYESSGQESADEYVQEKPQKKKKMRRARRVEGEGEERSRKRKRKPAAITEEDLAQLPPEQATKIRMGQQIEAILKPKKSNRPKKRKANEEVLDTVADEEVAQLREAMNNAADEDLASNKDRQPALAKLRLLPHAIETLRKQSLVQAMIDNNLLDAVRRWLEPLHDRSLPALNIQQALFDILQKMEFIDTSVLKESGLGRIVLFYTISKRVTPSIARIAQSLVVVWSRPIIKRSSSFRDKIIPVVEVNERQSDRLNVIIARAKATESNMVVKANAVAIPRQERQDYTVAPKSNIGIGRPSGMSVEVDIERRKKNAERMRMLTRKVKP